MITNEIMAANYLLKEKLDRSKEFDNVLKCNYDLSRKYQLLYNHIFLHHCSFDTFIDQDFEK